MILHKQPSRTTLQTKENGPGKPKHPRLKRRKLRLAGPLFLLPSLIGVSIFVLIPFADVIRRSFFTAMGGNFVGMKNYHTLFENKAFQQASYNTIRFMGTCIPALIALSLVVAVALSQSRRPTEIYKTTFLIPMAVPVASVVLLWRVLFHKKGLLNAALTVLGVTNAPDYMHSGWAFWILVISYLWKNLGYDLILWLAGLANIPKSQYEAAQVDGANGFQCFLYITMPNMMPTLFTITVLSFLNSFKVFREAYLIAGNYPDNSMYLLQHLFNNWFADLDMDKLCAAAVLVALIIFLFILLLQKSWEGDGD